jgi:hypothetical protein
VELLDKLPLNGAQLLAPFTARYRAVMWEPLPGTGERLVSLLSVETHESSAQAISPGTYCVLSAARLRQMLGRQRALAASGLLNQCARFMTERQLAGMPLSELRPLFQGFELGPTFVARAYSVEQLLDAAVRSISAFGSAEEMIEEEDARISPRHMIRTAEFLKQLRRIFTSEDKRLAARFDVPVRVSNAPSVTIDYADGPFAVQVTSLPTTRKQAENTEREAQSKLFELDVAKAQLDGNAFRPALLLNLDALTETSGVEALRQAEATRERIVQFAKFKGVRVLEAETPAKAARILDRQGGREVSSA